MDAKLQLVLWLLVLIFIGYNVGFACAGAYIIIKPFTLCVPGLKVLTDFLMQGMRFPLYCARQMRGEQVTDEPMRAEQMQGEQMEDEPMKTEQWGNAQTNQWGSTQNEQWGTAQLNQWDDV